MDDCKEFVKIHLKIQVYSLDREECGVKVLELKTSLPANPLRFVLRDNPPNLRVLLHLLENMMISISETKFEMWIDTNMLREDVVTFFTIFNIE